MDETEKRKESERERSEWTLLSLPHAFYLYIVRKEIKILSPPPLLSVTKNLYWTFLLFFYLVTCFRGAARGPFACQSGSDQGAPERNLVEIVPAARFSDRK